MRGYILAFAMGVILLQQQSELPGLRWAAALLPLAVIGVFPLSLPEQFLAVTGRTLLAILFLTGGFFWAAALAQLASRRCAPARMGGPRYPGGGRSCGAAAGRMKAAFVLYLTSSRC